MRKRARHRDEIVPQLHVALASRSALEWAAWFGEEVPCAAARSVEDMVDFPQVLAEDMIATYPHPVLGSCRGVTRAMNFDHTPGPEPFASPALGQRDAEIRPVASKAGSTSGS